MYEQVVDTKKNGRPLGNMTYSLKNLMTAKNMTINNPFSLKDSTPEAKVQLRLCLRVSQQLVLNGGLVWVRVKRRVTH